MPETFMEYCKRSGKEALLCEWAEEENLPLTARSVSRGSHQKVWWRCKNGHLWRAVVYARSAGSGCPYCEHKLPQPLVNDLLSRAPELAAQWDYQKNAPLTPEKVAYGMSLLREPRGAAGRKLASGLPPGDRSRVGHGKKRAASSDADRAGQRPEGLVGLPVRTFVEGGGLCQNIRNQRLSGLHRTENYAGFQRSAKPLSGNCRAVGYRAKRRGTGHRFALLQPAGLVAV